jgi:hypothetical protein
LQLGDYIDLNSLNVTAYNNAGAFNVSNIAIVPTPLPFAGYNGTLLRLIVVGINSFGGTTAHVVFQFQNVPVSRIMNSTKTQRYVNTQMHSYITDNFLAGLKGAGVPTDATDGILWNPSRLVWKGYGETSADSITDYLWLPTEWEMFGTRNKTHTSEGTSARLEYYDNDAKRIKYDSSKAPQWYWEESPTNDGTNYRFSLVGKDGGFTNYDSCQTAYGVAPAFCVK